MGDPNVAVGSGLFSAVEQALTNRTEDTANTAKRCLIFMFIPQSQFTVTIPSFFKGTRQIKDSVAVVAFDPV